MCNLGKMKKCMHYKLVRQSNIDKHRRQLNGHTCFPSGVLAGLNNICIEYSYLQLIKYIDIIQYYKNYSVVDGVTREIS